METEEMKNNGSYSNGMQNVNTTNRILLCLVFLKNTPSRNCKIHCKYNHEMISKTNEILKTLYNMFQSFDLEQSGPR